MTDAQDRVEVAARWAAVLAGATLPVLVLAAGTLWLALVRRLLQPSRERYWDDAWARFDHADDQASR